MAINELLGIYLNDHLAGATAGAELAQKLADNQGKPFGAFMLGLAADIDADRETLKSFMDRIGFDKHGGGAPGVQAGLRPG